MINYLAIAEYLPMLLTVTAIAALLIGVPYLIQITLCCMETECDYDI